MEPAPLIGLVEGTVTDILLLLVGATTIFGENPLQHSRLDSGHFY
jgi:hypothetical protein